MSVKENKIEGDVIISGDATTGGGVVANGDSVFNKDVIIKGKLDASNIRGASKGAFPDEATLKGYYPNPKTGWWALVKTGGQGTTFSFATYLAGPHGWYNSGKILENVSIDLTDIQLSNDNALAGLRNSINNEATTRQKADADLQAQIDRIMNSSGGTSGGTSGVALLPFDGIVSNVSVKTSGAPFPDAIVFDNATQRFIAKSGDNYYASWPEINDYGTTKTNGCIPNPGIYLLRSQVGGNKLADAIYKWTGSQMLLVSDFPTKTSDLINDSGFITLGDIPGTGGDLNNLASSALPFEFTTGAVGGVNIMTEVYEGSDGKIVHQNGVFYYQVQTPQGTLFYTKHADLSKYGNTASDFCYPENDRLYCDRNGKLYVGKNLQLVPTYATKVSELTDSADYAKTIDIPTNVGQLTNDAGYIKASEIGGDGNINIASSALRFNGFNHDAITVEDEEFEGVGLIIYSSVKSKFVFKGERNGVSAYYSKHKSLDIFGVPTSEGYSPRIGALYYYNQNLFIGIENGLVQLSGASGAGGGNAGSGIKSILPFVGYIEASSYTIDDTYVSKNAGGSVYYDKTKNKFFFIEIGTGGVFVSTKWEVSTEYGKTEDYGTVGSDGQIEAVEPSKGHYYICDNTIYTVKTYGLEIVAELDNGNSLSFDEITTEDNIVLKSRAGFGSGKIVFSSTLGCFLFKEEGLTSENVEFYIWHERLKPFGYITASGCKPYENKLYFCNNRAYRYVNRTLIPFGPTKVSELQNDSDFVTNADLSSSQTVKRITLERIPQTIAYWITTEPGLLQDISSALSEGLTIVFEFKFIDDDIDTHKYNGSVIPAIAIKSTIGGGRRFFISYFIHGWYVSVDVATNSNFTSIRVNEDSGYTKRIDLVGNPSQSPSLPDSGPSQSPIQPDAQSVFSRIGYTNEEVNICHDAELDYSEELRAKYENEEISNFSNDNTLVYPPMVNTGDLSDMSRFYYKCSNILTIPALNTSFVMSMVEMLAYCTSLRSIPYIETWNVQDMDSMFYNCSNLESIPQLVTSNVRNMSWMFGSCTSLKTIPMIDCHSVRNTSNMFNNCQALVTVPSLNTKSADNMKKMFADCAKLEKVEGLEFGNVTDMSMMFTGCTNLKHLLIYDLGKSQLEFYNFADVVAWGTGGESNRDSLIESLVEHSFDRASAGMTTATIRLSADSRALLTNDNISRIASKGYEVVVY